MNFLKGLPLFLLISLQGEVIYPEQGAGCYTTELPSHQWGPSQDRTYDKTKVPFAVLEDYSPAIPSFTSQFFSKGKPVCTHKFWASVAWKFMRPSLEVNGTTPDYSFVNYSNVLFHHPLASKLQKEGLALSYINAPNLAPMLNTTTLKPHPNADNPAFAAYTYDFPENLSDVKITFPNLKATHTLVEDYSDWLTTVAWSQGEECPLKVTLGQGSPFLFFETELNEAVITLQNETRLWLEKEGMVAFSREDQRTHYAIFAPLGSIWSYEFTNDVLCHVTSLRLQLPAGETRFTLAVLPEELNNLITVQNPKGVDGYPKGTTLQNIPFKKLGTLDLQGSTLFFQDFFGSFGGCFAAKGRINYQLPEPLLDLLAFFKEKAIGVPTNTEIGWEIDPSTNAVSTTYTLDTDTLVALYPHQWKNLEGQTLTPYTYKSPRGVMKVLEGKTFSTKLQFPGIIPYLPNLLKDKDRPILGKYLDRLVDPKNILEPPFLVAEGVLDTYFNGKELGRLAQVIPIAKQMKKDALADKCLNLLKSHLEDWFDASKASLDGLNHKKKYFYYDKTWNTLIGYPASFGSDVELNDHHFHYGYLIMTASVVARYDKPWAKKYAPMVEMLIKDVANWDRKDSAFPFLRHFDCFTGHSQANGHANFASGLNQESSSEAMNLATAIFLWGAEMDNSTLRDLGIFLYTQEQEAIKLYWFNKDNDTFPKSTWYNTGAKWLLKDFDQPSLGIVWSGKSDYATWFARIPHCIHGINFLPITTGSFYLADMPDKLKAIVDNMDNANHLYTTAGDIDDYLAKIYQWSDILWNVQALYDPGKASQTLLENPSYYWEHAPIKHDPANPQILGEAGESKAHTFHWISTLKELGLLNRTLTADTPYYAVFDKEGQRTYLIYNPSSTTLTVRFSDGKICKVPPNNLSIRI